MSEGNSSKKYIDEKFTSDEIEAIKGFSDVYSDGKSDALYISTEERISDINIEGYSRMQVVKYSMKSNDPDLMLNVLELKEYGTDKVVATVNIENLMNQYVEYALKQSVEEEYYYAGYVNIDSFYLEHCQVVIDENMVFVIRNFEITYNKKSEKIQQLELMGYLFDTREE